MQNLAASNQVILMVSKFEHHFVQLLLWLTLGKHAIRVHTIHVHAVQAYGGALYPIVVRHERKRDVDQTYA